MYVVGLTGGIGAGKSAVADLLVDRGALLIDADQVARDVVAPGGVVLAALVERFGDQILDADGALDRLALAGVTFGDPEALKALNAITHPAIGLEMLERRQAYASTDEVVIMAIPLLTNEHRTSVGLDDIVVIDCPTDIALDRLISLRQMDPVDAERRIAAQISREERRGHGDYVLDNGGDLDALRANVAILWRWMSDRHEALVRTRGQGD